MYWASLCASAVTQANCPAPILHRKHKRALPLNRSPQNLRSALQQAVPLRWYLHIPTVLCGPETDGAKWELGAYGVLS